MNHIIATTAGRISARFPKIISLFLSIALTLAGVSLHSSSQQSHSSSYARDTFAAIEQPSALLPDLQGEKAVEHLKEKGLYSSLEEAIRAAQYQVYTDDQGESDYYADNAAQHLSMVFDDAAMHLLIESTSDASTQKDEKRQYARSKAQAYSRSNRTSEARLRFLGAGYGERLLKPNGKPEMSADGNRFAHHHQLSGQWSVVSGQ